MTWYIHSSDGISAENCVSILSRYITWALNQGQT